MDPYTRYWTDALYREERRAYARKKMAETRAYARAARKDLRSLMDMDPRIAKYIRSCIDLGSASDAVVRRFYITLKWRYQNAQPKDRKRTRR